MRARLFPIVAVALAAANALVLACGGAAAPVGATTGGPEADATVDGAKGEAGADSATGTGTTDGAGGDDANADGAPVDDGASTADTNASDAATGDGGTGDGASGDGSLGDGTFTDAKTDGATDGASDGAGGTDASDAGGPIPCEDAGVLEVEPNGTLATATPMGAPIAGRSTICGRLASGADLDFVRFQMKPTATNLYWEWSGGVTPEFSVGGVVQSTVPFQTAQPYVVQLKLNNGVAPPLTWRFTYVEQ